MTYAELLSVVAGYNENLKNRRDELLFLAWHVEAFARQKQLPSLQSLIGQGPKKEQTDEEMLNMAKMLNAIFGGELNEV